MGDKSFTIHGDVNAPIIANFDKVFGDIEQTLVASPTLNQTNSQQLMDLFSEMKAALQTVPAEKSADVEAVTKRIQKLVEELKVDKPEKEDLEYHSHRLVKAAENLKQVTPSVLEIAGRVVKLIKTFVI